MDFILYLKSVILYLLFFFYFIFKISHVMDIDLFHFNCRIVLQDFKILYFVYSPGNGNKMNNNKQCLTVYSCTDVLVDISRNSSNKYTFE